MNSKRIALFGGSFDPIHLGHLAVAREVLQRVRADRVWFLPAFKSPNKSTDSSTLPEHRMAMVRCAIEDNPDFELCDLELKREGTSYTYETLETLHLMEPETWWYWILGLDTFFDLPDWKNSQRILELADLIVAPRPGYGGEKIQKTLAAIDIDAPEKFLRNVFEKNITTIATGRSDHQIHFLNQPVADLSSSRVRSQLRREIQQNSPIKKMLPPPVVQYIMDHQLYL